MCLIMRRHLELTFCKYLLPPLFTFHINSIDFVGMLYINSLRVVESLISMKSIFDYPEGESPFSSAANGARNHQTENLRGAFTDLENALVAIETFHVKLLQQSVTAHHLNGFITNFSSHL